MKRCTAYFLILLIILLCGCSIGKPSSDEYAETKLMMDTVCTIRAGGANAKEAVSAAFARIEEISLKADYFMEGSEVSAINRAKANEKIKVSEDVFEIIDKSVVISNASGGAFDITVAHFKDLWRIPDGAHKPPAEDEIKSLLPSVGYRQIILDADASTIVKKKDDIKIDLSGVAKGYAADCAVEVLKQSGADYAIVDLGGNVAVFGTNPTRADGKWVIGIQKPFATSGAVVQTVGINGGSVVTAGTYQRYFEWDGELYHHIIDPKTGCPSKNGVTGATIVADSALIADGLATASVVMGEEEGRKLAEKFGAELIVNQEGKQ